MTIINLLSTLFTPIAAAEETKPQQKEHVYPGASAVKIEADKKAFEKLLKQEGQTAAKICNNVFWADWQDVYADAHRLGVQKESLEEFCDMKAQ